jgi:flavodoxin
MKTLIAYFSHAGENYFVGGYRTIKKGNAKIIAEKVQQYSGADIFEIETKKQYSDSYKICCDEALAEQKQGVLPELVSFLPSIDAYDNIVLVYPCWWGTMPQAVFTFLNHYNFDGKTIFPICTHEGSGMGRSERDIAKTCAGAKIASGLAIQGSVAENSDAKISAWLGKSGLV